MRRVECSFWIAIDSADSRRYFYSNTNVSARRVTACEMCAGNDQFGKDLRLWYGDPFPCYSGSAWKLLQDPQQGFIWFFTLKQQYKNNRLLMGACRHLSFSPHVACTLGAPRTFRLGRHRSAASCTLRTPIVLGSAWHRCYKHWKQWQKQRNKEEVGGGGKVSCWCQTKTAQHITRCCSYSFSPNNPNSSLEF